MKLYAVLLATSMTSRKRHAGDAYSNALRNSGAARMLLPYRIHRAGYSDAMESAQEAVGNTVGNPVTGLAIVGCGVGGYL